MNLKKILEKKTILYSIIFIIYAIINLLFVLFHEPWRDEIHAWLMAKNLSVPELITESRFDGHPILWHLLLMPFAKLNFPIITLNIISYLIILASSYLFLYKTNIPLGIKIFALFTIPFTYTYSAISRNYCLIILFLVSIVILYPKRYKRPIFYSILICLLIHTHSLAWGIVAGLTITFHFYEIYLWRKNKNTANIKSIFIGLILIVFNTILVVLQLYGTSNTDYSATIHNYIIEVVSTMALILLTLLLYTIFILKNNYKEYIILFCSLAFQIIIYLFVYSSVLFQRYILIFTILLFYILLVSSTQQNIKNLKYFILCIFYITIVGIFGAKMFFTNITQDCLKPYSSAKEMADYINNNIPKGTTLLIDASIIGQSILPYLDNSYKFYDIAYEQYVDCANVSHNRNKIKNALQYLDKYSGNYLIICNDFVKLKDFQILYKTAIPIVNEYFTLYYIP